MRNKKFEFTFSRSHYVWAFGAEWNHYLGHGTVQVGPFRMMFGDLR